MKNKVYAWVYTFALIAGIANAYFAYKGGNLDAMFAWICASGMAGGASAAYMEIIKLKKEDEDSLS